MTPARRSSSDNREGNLRIYYAVSTDGGASWNTAPSGQPLLAGLPIDANIFHFHPQIVFWPNGVLGCAFYEFGPKPAIPKIDAHGCHGTVTAVVENW